MGALPPDSHTLGRAPRTTRGYTMNGEGKAILVLWLIATNGFWCCATQQDSIGATPLLLVPIVASILLLWQGGLYLEDTWEDSL